MAYERKYVSRLVPSDLRLLTVLLVAVSVVNSATLGYDGSMMNGLLILPSYSEYFNLTTATTGLNNAAVWMGGILGTFTAQFLPDRFGRKNAILISSAITGVGILLQAAAQNIAMFVVARIIVGFGTQISNAAAPTLLAELLPPRQRSRVLGIFFSCYYVGSLLSSIINYGSQNIPTTWAWRLPSLLQFIPSVLAVALLPFVPESPRWLLHAGREDEAREVLLIMQGAGIEDEAKAAETVAEIKAFVAKEEEQYPRNAWRELVSTPGNRKRLFLLVSFGSMINTWGNFVISFYLSKILTQAGVTSTLTQTQIQVSINCWCFATAILGSFMLDVLGRRAQTLASAIGMTTMLFIIGGLIKTYGNTTDTSGIYGTIAVIFLFQGFYSFAITPMTSLYPSEISQYKLRAAGVAVFRFWDSAFGLMFSFAMSYAMADLDWKFYLINASWDVAFCLVIYFTFVETKGLKLEEIALKFEGNAPVGVTDDEGHCVAARGGSSVVEKGTGDIVVDSAPKLEN